MPLFYDIFADYGLFVLGGDAHKLLKKNINPVFFPTQLKNFFPIIKIKTDEFMEHFDEQLEPLKEIDFSRFSLDFALDTLLMTLFSKDDTTEDERREFIEANET